MFTLKLLSAAPAFPVTQAEAPSHVLMTRPTPWHFALFCFRSRLYLNTSTCKGRGGFYTMSFVLAHLKSDETVPGPTNTRGVVLVVGCRQSALPYLKAQFSLRSPCLKDRLLSDSQVPASISPLSRHQICLDSACVRAILTQARCLKGHFGKPGGRKLLTSE